MTLPTATTLPVERRFPLTLKESILSIRDLYETGKRERWTPMTGIDWNQLAPSRYDAQARDAGRLTWSWRAWVEYAGLTETPATLIRLCLEAGRESDPKYFLTVRNTEEAWHIECFHRLAQEFGGYVDRPPAPAHEALFEQRRDRAVLDAAQHVDAFFAAHSAVEDGLELALYEAHLANAVEPVAHAVLARAVAAKRRHASFGWLYLSERAHGWSDADRAAVSQAVHVHLRDVELAGYHCPWLAQPDGVAAGAAERMHAEGLGAAGQAREAEVLRTYVGDTRTRLAELGVELPMLAHSALGEF